MPLYRTSDASEANLLPGLLELLTKELEREVTAEDFLAYVYGVLAHPAFTKRYREELGTCQVRVPVTKDPDLFERVRDVGARLLWLHTYSERFVPDGWGQGQVPSGKVRCTRGISGEPEGYPKQFYYDEATLTLYVGDGVFAPVSPAVFHFEVSGLKVVQSWLKYRMKQGAGRKSSPLDDIRPERWTDQFTMELLELLWVLEATVEGYPEQATLLEEVIESECFTASELPDVPEEMRKPPAHRYGTRSPKLPLLGEE